MKSKGTLYICPTPIGNLEDITLRVISTLKTVDLIAAEDTRHTLKLLNHFDIKKPLTSYHEHNIKEKGELLITKLMEGNHIAVVTDAGMPGISDPGQDLIKLAIENNILVTALPGPTASILGLVLSGLPTERFVFEGFLPSNKSERKKRLTEVKLEKRTIIFYESPHRLKDFLKDTLEVLGNRRISVARELTKIHEEVLRSSISEVIERFSEREIKGEFVIVIEGSSLEEKLIDASVWESMSIKDHLLLYINEGFDKKEAIKKVAQERNISKKEVYKESISL